MGKGTRLLRAVARHGLPAILLVYVFLILVVPLADPDLFWHLKSGQWILQQGELPGPGYEDPFSYTTPRPLSETQVEGLRSQWLGQVVLYLVYKLGGYPGLIVFRILMILAPFIAVYVLSVRKGLSPLGTVPVLLLPVLLIAFSLHYTFERPQAFTFAMCFLLVPLLWRLRRPGGRRWPWVALLAVMMALWSNLHGGFIFGVVMIWVFTLGVLIEAVLYRKSGPARSVKEGLFMLVPAALGTAASLLNPNTYSLLYGFLSDHIGRFLASSPVGGAATGGMADVVGELLEYKPLWFFYKEFHYIWPPLMMAYMALAVIVALASYAASRRVGFAEALLLAAFVVFGLYYTRGVTLAMVVLPLFVVFPEKDTGRIVRLASGGIAAVLCAVLVFLTFQRSPWQLYPSMPASWVDASYPEGAVRFIKDKGIKGPMFNDLRWGGYLIWRLHPGHKVFMDGRLISRLMFDAHLFIARAVPGHMKQLDAFGVNFILTRVMARESGVMMPLSLKFIEDEPEGWKLVFMEGNSALFLRNIGRNRHVIERYGLPYKVLNGLIFAEAESLARMMPGHPGAFLSMAIALTGLERYEEAGRILRALPPSPIRDRYLKRVQEKGRKF